MSRHDDVIRLRHMRDHAAEAIAMTRRRKRVDLDDDRMLELALVRLMEIIGEAAGRVTPETRAQLPTMWNSVFLFLPHPIRGILPAWTPSTPSTTTDPSATTAPTPCPMTC